LRILWFSWKDIRHPLAGGAERLGHEWRRRLVAAGHTVRHVTARHAGSTAADTIDGVETIRRGRSSVAHYPAALAFHLRDTRSWADCVVEEVNTVPYFVPAGRARLVLVYFQLARDIWFYQMPRPIGLAGYAAEAVYTRVQSWRGAPVITISEDSRQDLLRFGFSPSRVAIARVGIENAPLTTYDPAEKARGFTVLFHGSLRAMKRPVDALNAFEAFSESAGACEMWLSGDGADPSLRRRIAAAHVNPRLRLFGRTTDAQKLELMRRASVLVSTSVKEGWGLIVTEANSMGTPAIVYDVDGLRSAAGAHNWVCPPTAGALAAKLSEAARVFSEPDRYGRWCEAVLDDSRQYTYDRSYREFEAALMRAVE
jgi:glycosyltransferase involved in cell wall biosynthesis